MLENSGLTTVGSIFWRILDSCLAAIIPCSRILHYDDALKLASSLEYWRAKRARL